MKNELCYIWCNPNTCRNHVCRIIINSLETGTANSINMNTKHSTRNTKLYTAAFCIRCKIRQYICQFEHRSSFANRLLLDMQINYHFELIERYISKTIIVVVAVAIAVVIVVVLHYYVWIATNECPFYGMYWSFSCRRFPYMCTDWI